MILQGFLDKILFCLGSSKRTSQGASKTRCWKAFQRKDNPRHFFPPFPVVTDTFVTQNHERYMATRACLCSERRNSEDPEAVSVHHVLKATARKWCHSSGRALQVITIYKEKKKIKKEWKWKRFERDARFQSAFLQRLKKISSFFFTDDAIHSNFTHSSGEIRNAGMFVSSGHRTSWGINIGLECSG